MYNHDIRRNIYYYLDINSIETIYLIDELSSEILNDKCFWLDKFKTDKLYLFNDNLSTVKEWIDEYNKMKKIQNNVFKIMIMSVVAKSNILMFINPYTIPKILNGLAEYDQLKDYNLFIIKIWIKNINSKNYNVEFIEQDQKVVLSCDYDNILVENILIKAEYYNIYKCVDQNFQSIITLPLKSGKYMMGLGRAQTKEEERYQIRKLITNEIVDYVSSEDFIFENKNNQTLIDDINKNVIDFGNENGIKHEVIHDILRYLGFN